MRARAGRVRGADAAARAAGLTPGELAGLEQSGTTNKTPNYTALASLIGLNGTKLEVRSPIAGRVRSFSVVRGAQVQAGSELAVMDPAPEQVWEALRALYLVGQKEDLPAVTAYGKNSPNMPDRVRDQAILTEKAILERERKK